MRLKYYSLSIVAGGLPEISYTTRGNTIDFIDDAVRELIQEIVMHIN